MITLFRFFARSFGRLTWKTAVGLAFFILGASALAAMMLYGQQMLELTPDRIEELLLRGAASPFVLLCVISIFVLVSFTGMPHLFLIVGTLAVFGFPDGAIYAWVGAMSSAISMYILGAFFFQVPGKMLRFIPFKGSATYVRAHGIVISSFIWLVPAQLFVIANLLFGAVKLPFHKLVIGTGLASLVRIGVIMAVSDQLEGIYAMITTKDPVDLLTIAGLFGGWLVFVLLIRHFLVSGPTRLLFNVHD